MESQKKNKIEKGNKKRKKGGSTIQRKNGNNNHSQEGEAGDVEWYRESKICVIGTSC